MKLETSRFGSIEVQEQDILFMADGLVGFPELHQFILLDHDEDSPFKWLQSIDDSSVAFVVVSPYTFRPDYTVDVGEDDVAGLNFARIEDAVLSVIVTIPADPRKMSANLKAPLVFNAANRTGKQLILKESHYLTRHYILDEIRRFHKKDMQDKMVHAFETPFGLHAHVQAASPIVPISETHAELAVPSES